MKPLKLRSFQALAAAATLSLAAGLASPALTQAQTLKVVMLSLIHI